MQLLCKYHKRSEGTVVILATWESCFLMSNGTCRTKMIMKPCIYISMLTLYFVDSCRSFIVRRQSKVSEVTQRSDTSLDGFDWVFVPEYLLQIIYPFQLCQTCQIRPKTYIFQINWVLQGVLPETLKVTSALVALQLYRVMKSFDISLHQVQIEH